MDLIYMNSAMEDIGVLTDYELDLAFGADENDFECQIQTESHCCEAGFYLYIEGTEYGGIIDNIKIDTAINRITYSGRTWHGMLDSKILEPDSGQAYLTVSGEANQVIASLLSRMGLSDLFAASYADSGINIKSYQMNRYVTGYSGIVKMLDTVGAKLQFNFQDRKVIVSAVMKRDYTQDDEFDSDNVDFILKKKYNTVNHLVCLGGGELEDRTVVHLYADEDGNISHTQTFFGLEECTAVYDYPSAGSVEELINGGTERLKSLMIDADFIIDCDSESDSFDVGDVVGAYDNATKILITSPIKKKIVSISNGRITITLKPGQSKNNGSASAGGGGGGGNSGGGGSAPWGIGAGLTVNGNILSVDTADSVEENNAKPVTSGAVYEAMQNMSGGAADEIVDEHNNNVSAHPSIQASVVTALKDAKNYADEQSGTVLQESKTYADEQDATVLNEAKSYVDNAVADSVSDTKDYVDSRLADVNDPEKAVDEHNKSTESHPHLLALIEANVSSAELSEAIRDAKTEVMGNVETLDSNTRAYVDRQVDWVKTASESYADLSVSLGVKEANRYTDQQIANLPSGGSGSTTNISFPFPYYYMPPGYPRDEEYVPVIPETTVNKVEGWNPNLGDGELIPDEVYEYVLDGELLLDIAMPYEGNPEKILLGAYEGTHIMSYKGILALMNASIGEHTVKIDRLVLSETMDQRFLDQDHVSRGVENAIETAVSDHNTAADAHADIRKELTVPIEYWKMPGGYPRKLDKVVIDTTYTSQFGVFEAIGKGYLKLGEKYIVTIDGVTHETTAKPDAAGNVSLSTEDYTQYAKMETANHVIRVIAPVGTHTVKIESVADEVVETLAAEFVPPEAVNPVVEAALTEAKASGEFDGEPGKTPVKGTDYWTAADKAEMVNELKSLTGIGTMYKGAWTATTCTGISQTYTETLVLPAGTYLVSVVAPYCADLTARVCISFSAKMAMGSGATFIDAAYGCVTMLATFTTQTNLRVLSAASNNSATWSYLDRGGIAAVRVG